MRHVWCLSLLVLVAGAVSLSVDKERPVTKVINLLKDMSAQLQKEAEKDEELFENFKCWCETYDKEKTGAIATANQMIDDLTAAIEEGTAKKAQLETDTEKLKKEVAEKTKALEEASGIRSKENSEFTASEQDLSSTITSLGGAVKALGNAHGEAFAQQSMLQVQQILKRHLAEHKAMFGEKFTPQQHSTVMSFLQQPVAAQSYASQSGAIFGILKGMKESFETNLETSRKDESTAASEYGMLKTAKNKEVTAANDQIDANTNELAETKVKLSNDKESLEDTRAALAADTAFLDDLKSKCASMDKQWEARSKMRNDEITAVSETIKILDDDEAHDTFSRSLGFVQRKTSKADVALRRRVSDFLRAQGSKLHSPKLSALAVSVKQDDIFAKVKKNMEDLVANLKVTQEEEVKERDFCVEELNTNEDQTTAAKNKKEDLEQRIEDLKVMIESATEEIARAKQEIHETHVAMKQAGGNRAAENKEFQMTVADQRATQGILKKALDRLAEFYKSKAALLQRSRQEPGAAAPEAPAGFGEYQKAGGSTGAMGLLEMIVKESAATEKQAIEDEQEAQSDYEVFRKESFSSINALTAEITDKTEQLAKADGKKTLAETDLANTQDDIYNLGDYKLELHRRCDYLLDNFDVRQSSRAGEVDSLEEGMAMFSGAKFGL